MKYGKIITKDLLKYYEIAPDVYAAISENKGLSHSNAGFINRGKGMVIDTFQGMQYARELKKFCMETAGHLPGYVVNTHSDTDHAWGNQVFSGSTIIQHKNCTWEHLNYDPENSRKMRQIPNPPVGVQWLMEQTGDLDITGVEWWDADIFIDADTTVMLGDTEVQLLNFAPAHSNSDLIIWLPKEKIMWVGDIVFESGGYVCYNAQGMRLWLKAWDRIINELKPDIIVPGHGGLCDCEEVKKSIGYWELLLSEFDRLYTDDITIMDMCKKIDITPYIGWLQPERLFINIRTLMNDRRGLPNKPDWNYFATEMAELKKFQEEHYDIPEWDPKSSWKE